MKYFTWDILDRFGSSDDAVADRASEEWEEKIGEYTLYWEGLKSRVPNEFRTFSESYYLHDSKITFPGQAHQNGSSFSFQIEPVNEKGMRLVLDYQTIAPPMLLQKEKKVKPQDVLPGNLFYWLYDEIAEINTPDQAFSHHILMEEDLELIIPFCDFSFKVLSPPLPSPAKASSNG